MENKKGTGNFLKVRLNSVKCEQLHRCVSIVNFSCLASVKENVAVRKAKPTSNLKDITMYLNSILLHRYRCVCQYSFEDLTLDIYLAKKKVDTYFIQ